MIRETLTAIGAAGRQALQCLGASVEVRTQISQVREWSFAMPHLVLVTVANSPIHQIYVGLSQPLAQALGDPSRQGVLLEEFKQALAARVPAKRPIVTWTVLPPDGRARVLRGVRSFILRQQTKAGNLYLMADVASRCEYESLRQLGWEDELAAQLLPGDLGKVESIDSQIGLARLASYLVRCEHDLELFVPGADDLVHSGRAVLINTSKDQDQTLLWLSLDFDKEQRHLLQPGLELEGSFGAAGRLFRFRTRCVGEAGLALDDVAALPCAILQMPSRVHLDQRRRYFRVKPESPLVALLTILPALPDHDLLTQPLPQGPAAATVKPVGRLTASIVDLSFSGLGLLLEGEPPPELGLGGRVRMALEGEGLPRSLELSGQVLRLNRIPRGRGRCETSLGVEFAVEGPADQQSAQLLRQYVMAQQRRLLARRSADDLIVS